MQTNPSHSAQKTLVYRTKGPFLNDVCLRQMMLLQNDVHYMNDVGFALVFQGKYRTIDTLLKYAEFYDTLHQKEVILMAETFQPILTNEDIAYFLEKTNGLHDSYLIGVQYIHNGHRGGNPHWINPELSELCVRYMVTSIQDTIIEMVFSTLIEWQIKDNSFDVTDTAVFIAENGNVIWADDYSTAPGIRENGSYVIAEKMKWRFIDA